MEFKPGAADQTSQPRVSCAQVAEGSVSVPICWPDDDAKPISLAFADKNLSIKHISGLARGRGRSSDNKLVAERWGWESEASLLSGVSETFEWIETQVW